MLLFGASGMLGHDLHNRLTLADHTPIAISHTQCDISDGSAVKELFSTLKQIDWVINAAAYTAVDQSEIEQALCHQINAIGPQNLANACKEKNVPFIHFSTDYVFDGTKETPYIETDTVNPINAYGTAKLAGEIAIQAIHRETYICRIQWLYGESGNHFVKKISKLAQTKPSLSIVSDQWGSPTWTRQLSEAIVAMIHHRPDWGIYHMANKDYTNWYEFATYFLDRQSSSCQLSACDSAAYPVPAKRPLNSRLNTQKFHDLGIYTFPTWQTAIEESLPLLL